MTYLKTSTVNTEPIYRKSPNQKFMKKTDLIKFGINQGINHYLQKISRYTGFTLCKPSQIIFDITNKCNLKCKQCFAWKTKMMKTLTIQEWVGIIKNLKNSFGPFFLTITGGEPLLRKDIREIIKFSSKNGILVNLITNGVILNKKRRKEIAYSKPYQVTVSLESINKNVHDSMKGVKNACSKTISNILELKKEHPSLKITISTVITDYNTSHLISLIKWVHQNNLNGIRFQAFSEPFWNDEMFNKKKLEKNKLWPKDTRKIAQIMEDIIGLKREGYRIKNSYSQLKAIKKYFKNPYAKGVNCNIGVNSLHVTPKGEAKVCMHSKTIGNLLKEPARKIWKSKKSREIRKGIKECERSCRILNCYYEETIFKKISDFLSIIRKN